MRITNTIVPLLFALGTATASSSIRERLKDSGISQPYQYPVLAPEADRSLQATLMSGVIISDVIGKTDEIAIFSGLTRDVDNVSNRLDNAAMNATVLAPNNAAMKRLPRKPWEDAQEYEVYGNNAYEGQSGEDRASRNIQRFVEAHIVPQSPWKENEKVKTLAGNTVWYEHKNGKTLVQPGNIEVTSIADRVANGEVWIIDGAVYA